MTAVVSFREYETIRVCPVLSSLEERAITVGELEVLDKLSTSLGIQLIEHLSRNQVRPKQYVGSIQMPNRILEFLPKIETSGAEDLHIVRHNLLEMLLVAYDLNGTTSGHSSLADRSIGWLDLLIKLFCRALADQVRRGLVKRYRVEEGDLPTVRGRILLDEQVRRNLIHRERSACEYDEFDENHPLNQLFRLAVYGMLRVAASASTQQAVRELLSAFENVADVRPNRAWLDSIKLDRMSERYGLCLALARLFLQGMTTDIYSGRQQSFALMFDMNELFERYIGKQMRRVLRPEGHEVLLQHSKHHLARDANTNLRLFQLRPDMVVTTDCKPTCIVDTKWKRLQTTERKLGIAQGDLYQMLAYSERYQCESILLLYPWNHSGGSFLGIQKQLRFEEKASKVTIGEVALQNLSTVPAQLLNLVSTALAHQ